ncbi:hypothetical protein GOODEAATRI_018855 [Goodea atripinnis]|uniref:Uncharacterized protein n=1 Tax=Goodea atripinnis TaxID=208336 RepID=A0ABV0PZ69_9TELE
MELVKKYTETWEGPHHAVGMLFLSCDTWARVDGKMDKAKQRAIRVQCCWCRGLCTRPIYGSFSPRHGCPGFEPWQHLLHVFPSLHPNFLSNYCQNTGKNKGH